jgi:hypothetical protein
MIEIVKGDIFASGCQALVNPVNCVGVMGKGLVLQFKQRWPAMFVTKERNPCLLKKISRLFRNRPDTPIEEDPKAGPNACMGRIAGNRYLYYDDSKGFIEMTRGAAE